MGIAIGYFLIQAKPQQQATPTINPSPITTKNNKRQNTSTAGPLVWVTLTNANGEKRYTGNGLLVNPGNHLVLPIAALYQATQGQLFINNKTLPLGKVIGTNIQAGLAVIKTAVPQAKALLLPETESLYLGLELNALVGDAILAGSINTPIQETADGKNVFGFQFDSPQQAAFTALILPDSNTLVGILTGRLIGGLYEAIDTSTLNSLTIPNDDGSPLSIAEFSHRFFNETLEGQLFSFYHAAQTSDWQTIVDTGPALLNTHLANDSVLSTLEQAYLKLSESSIASGDINYARNLLRFAITTLPDNISIIHSLANIENTAGRAADALQILHQSIDNGLANNHTYQLLEEVVLNIVNKASLANTQKQQLLEQAIQYQPAIASYHAALGKLHYHQGDYAGALTEFNYAAQLDANFYYTLNSLMENARSRLQSPQHITVPLHSNGNSYMVDVKINGTSRRLILDTGASITAVSGTLAQELGINISNARHVQLSTANGIINAPIVKANSIELNGAKISDLDLVVIKQMHGNGLLGLNFLNHFNIDINQASNEMILSYR